jgi:RNA polymerase sigma-70 factor, ECF subfamily
MRLDYEALIRQYERYAKSLLAFFQRRIGDPELALDLMAETFALALERRAQFRGSTDAQLSGWLWSIAQSVLREHQRRGKIARRGALQLGRERRALADVEMERIEDLAASETLRSSVARHLALLPREQREAVRLRIVDDLPYNEIARSLGVTPSAVRTRVARAMRQLRFALGVDEDGG